MNKSELVAAVAAKAEMSKAAAAVAVEAVLDAVIETVKKGESVQLIGFGTFSVAERAARKGVNPATKAVIGKIHQHSWRLDSWTWSEDFTSAKANFVCRYNSDHKNPISAKVTYSENRPTCTSDGSQTYTATATLEGVTRTDTRTETVAALGHNWGEWTVTTEATCDHAGVETRTCQRDGCTYSETRPIAQLEHKTVYVPAVAPTCTADGSMKTVFPFADVSTACPGNVPWYRFSTGTTQKPPRWVI